MGDNAYSGNFSTLQHLLQLAYSEDPEKQQKSAMELAKLVDGTPFPAVSFGPLTHALCKLIPSDNRTVASYAAKALKMLLLDDALRPQAANIVPGVVCGAILHWEDEILCLRELLAALQTLCWDKLCVKSVLSCPQIITALIDHAQSTDVDVSVLALSSLANVFVWVDTAVLLSAEQGLVDEISSGMAVLLEIIKTSPNSAQKFYATAAVANATAHPIFRNILKNNGALDQMKIIERQSFANLHIIGSKIGDCAQTVIHRITNGAEGNPSYSTTKYSFKWGSKPIMELSLSGLATFGNDKHNSNLVYGCFATWLCIILYLFFPFIVGGQ